LVALPIVSVLQAADEGGDDDEEEEEPGDFKHWDLWGDCERGPPEIVAENGAETLDAGAGHLAAQSAT
jgi:hypothetical protein